MMLWGEHVSVNLWTWAREQEQIYLEYFDDRNKIVLEYPYATWE